MSPITQIQQNQKDAWTWLKKLVVSVITCLRIRQILGYRSNEKKSPQLIPPQNLQNKKRKTLVLDLDETLVHSSFVYVPDSDFDLKILVNGVKYPIYVRVRPGAEEFLIEMSKIYEVFIFTASLSEYANPVIDRIDPHNVSTLRLFRENCRLCDNVFVKDLSQLNRQLSDIIIIDNSVNSFMLHPENAIHIKNFFNDQTDTELYDLVPFLKLAHKFNDIRPLNEQLQKFNRFQKITFTNDVGQRVSFTRSSEDNTIQITQEEYILTTSPDLDENHHFIGQGLKKIQSINLDDQTKDNGLRISANLNSPRLDDQPKDSFVLHEDEEDEV